MKDNSFYVLEEEKSTNQLLLTAAKLVSTSGLWVPVVLLIGTGVLRLVPVKNASSLSREVRVLRAH